MESIIIEILVIVVLILFSAFFSGSEAALLSVNRIHIRHLADSGNKTALTLLELFDNPEQFLTAILIGNNIVNISASVLATDISLRLFGDSGVAIATGVMTLIVLVFSEVLPKTLGSRNSVTISMKIAKPIKFTIYVLKPVVKILTAFINFIITSFGGKQKVKNPFVTEEIIKVMLKVGEKEGTIEKQEREMIHNIFEFTDEKASGIMTKKENMVCIEESQTLDDALSLINESGHSRIPVYKKKFGNFVGMIYAKDLLKYRNSELKNINVHQILRQILVVNDGRKISSILKELQKKKINIAVVVDNAVNVVGLLSVEDILEELVGEIYDEYDIDEL